MTSCINKKYFFNTTSHTLSSCFAACGRPQLTFFAKFLFTRKKQIDINSSNQSMIDSRCLQTESHSIQYLAFRIIAFLNYRHYRHNMTAQCFTVSMETVNTTMYDGTLFVIYKYSQSPLIQTLKGAIENVHINRCPYSAG